MSHTPLETHIHESGGSVVATLQGEIDSSNAPALAQSLSGQATGQRLVLDLRQVDYLDSAGIAAIATLHRSNELYLVAPPESTVHRILIITGLDHLIPLIERVEDVPASAADGPPR